MRLDKLAVTAQEAFQASMGVAGDAQSSTIEPIHLLKAMLDASENNLSAIIKRIGADPAQLSQNVDAAIAAMPKASGSTMPMAMPSNNLMKVIDNAVQAAARMGKPLRRRTAPCAVPPASPISKASLSSTP